MSKASRLTRPPSIGARSKLAPSRKECPGATGRARVLSVGEKLMRAGSDGILSRQRSFKAAAPQDKAQSENQPETPAPGQGPGEKGQDAEMLPPKSRISPPKVASQPQGSVHKQTKSNLKVTSPEDAQHVGRRQASPNGTPKGDAKGSRTVPRRHTLGGARGAREILAMQPPDMDKKREAFLEHLKQKYPHHASAIMGHQERLREQSVQGMLSSLRSELDIQRYLMKIQLPHRSRSPKHGPHSSIGDQVDHLSLASLDSLDAMSEADSPTAFTRGSRIRASLPVVRSTNQTKDRSLGVLYLLYGDETKQIRMPNEITSMDTIRALFVSAFPQQLTMKMLESPSVAVYVKDDMRNIYYELADVRNIADHSCLKVYHKDPAQAFSHGPRPANGDARMHSETMHAVRDGPPPLRQPHVGPPSHHPMQGAVPPSPHSMPPSPSRIPFGPRQGSIPGNGTIPRDRLSSANAPARSSSPCPSAILERRDVKPDEDRGGKSQSLPRGNESLYADPYLLQDGRMNMAAAHGPQPNPGIDGTDHAMGGFHRASIRSTSSYGGPSPTDTMDHPSLYRQKSRNSQLPTLGSKTPPPSPHRMAEVRMIDIHGGPPHGGPPYGGPLHGMPPHGVPPHGMPPHGVPPHGMPPHGGPPHGMPPHVLPPHGGPPHGLPPHAAPPHGVPMERSSPVRQSFRKEEVAGTKPRNNMGSPVVPDLQGPIAVASEHQTRERPPKTSSPAHSAHSSGGSPVLAAKSSTAPPATGPVPLKVNLLQFRRNVSDLRVQLHQMRQQQVQNQEALRVQLKRAEQEISVKLIEAMRGLEDPVQRQRALVEEDRHKYLVLEERVLTQLGELEQYVGSLQKDLAATQRAVTLKDVEEGAVTLRKVGESLAGLKGEFPALQTKMRSVLRVEVEAVKFLKEEPHKLDSMLKRVKSLTDTLNGLRRCAPEGPQKGPVDNSSPAAAEAPTPPARPSSSPGPLEPQSSTIKSEVMPSSPVVIHHVQSSPVHIRQSQQSAALTAQPSPPLTPSPTPSKSQDLARGGGASDPPSPAHHKKTQGNPVNNGNGPAPQGLVIEELQTSREKNKDRAMSIKAAEMEWEERRQNMGHYDGKEFEKILQEAQANMMKGIPSLEVEENPTLIPDATTERADTHSLVESLTEPQSEPHSDKPGQKGPEKLPKPVMEKPAKPSKTVATKPTESFAKQGSEKSGKSPPPPPPPRKTFSSSSSGMTTTRSGEVVFTSRRESVSAQECEEDTPPPSPQPKPNTVRPETKPKPATPPPVTPLATREEEDEGDKIMAELQVFQKCTVKDVGVKNLVEPTSRIEPQIRELRPGALLPLKEKKSSEPTRDDKDPDIDENGNTTVRQSQGVIYYVTGQIPKEHPPPSGTEETPEHREPTQPPSQNTSVASPTSRMPVPLSAKSRQSPGASDKAGKQQKLQDAQRQFRQANGSAKRVGGDHKTTSPTTPTSKIPAFYPSSTKGSSQSVQNSDATNPINPSSSSSSSSSAIKSNTLSSPASRSGSQPSSHIPSLSNGSLKLPSPSQHTGKALSFSSQTQNGRVHSSSSFSSSSSSSSTSSSSSPSPLSPTPVGPGGKSIRTIHTPSFTSYRSHNGSSGKSCIPTATAAKDAA
ncbi:sickle tail protein homolog isoform X27 [Gasterosteus aculeatus]